jgi:hypothetical protein
MNDAESSSDGFFAIDQGVFRKAYQGGMNEAISYLVLACGTGRNHAKTSWSVQAIETYTGISRPRAHKAVNGLIERAVIRKDKGGTRPSYTLLNPKTVKGEANNLIWLPNTLVTGTTIETPPFERIRQSQNIAALWLFVDMYAAQNLRADGGIHWGILRKSYKRDRLGERREFVIWGFSAECNAAFGETSLTAPHIRGKANGNKSEVEEYEKSWKEFWERLGIIEKLGLFEYVGHLIESDTHEAEIIHPYTLTRGLPIERELTLAGHEAASGMVTEAQLEISYKKLEGYPLLVPLHSHFVNAQLVGIPRLRYRPHTKLTAAWYANTMSQCDEYLTRYKAMIKQKEDLRVATSR